MKTSRSILVWATLALCGVMVLGAMLWLTRGVLAAERERAGAEARADLEECTRLALWRLDAAGAAIVANESRRPPVDFLPDSATPPTNSDPLIKLHFELRENGRLSSSEATEKQATLAALRALLGKNPIQGSEWMTLICAANASETAWSQVPKEASAEQSANALQRQNLSRDNNRGDSTYQTNFTGAEKTKRAQTVEETVISNQAYLVNPLKEISATQVTELGAMRSIWIGSELFLLRQFSFSSSGNAQKGVQGVWLDHAVVKQRLLAGVRDLLPNADLKTITDSSQDPLALVSLPFRLERNESSPTPPASINKPLLIGWIAVLLALFTASLLVHGVMRLSERRASFVSAVTHELRTPLTTFRLYSDMLESGAVKEEKRGDYLRVLSREADRLSHLVENVLSFSKIERGSARSVIRETTVMDLLETMRERLEARLATAGMTLEMNVTSTLSLRVDSAAVEHILFNLIDNAAKYASAGEPPKVVIRTVASGKKLEIHVSDFGPGIPVAERRRIFRAFHKSAHEAAESRPGVGLGLALSRRLAKSLGGGLECVNSKQGACFVLSLPIT